MKHNSGFLKIVEEAKARVAEIKVTEYRMITETGQPHVLVDVREESEWAAGHAASAMHLGKGIIERDIETLLPDPETLLVLYCGGGFRSVLAGDAIARMGYRNVKSLVGGWRAWNEAELPVMAESTADSPK